MTWIAADHLPTWLAAVEVAVPPLLCASMVLSSLRERGPRITRLFFAWGFGFFFLKGYIDTTRPFDEMPFLMHVRFLDPNGRNHGMHLLVMPCLRVAVAYVATCVAEAIATRLRGLPLGLFRMCGLSLLGFALAGLGIEIANETIGWWTWKPEVHAGPQHYFFNWLIWGGGFFEALHANWTAWRNVRRPWRLALAYVLGYYVLISILGRIAPFLRQAVLIPFNMLVIAAAVIRRGPHLLPIRRGPLTSVGDFQLP